LPDCRIVRKASILGMREERVKVSLVSEVEHQYMRRRRGAARLREKPRSKSFIARSIDLPRP
jgi:hypothetical protein